MQEKEDYSVPVLPDSLYDVSVFPDVIWNFICINAAVAVVYCYVTWDVFMTTTYRPFLP